MNIVTTDGPFKWKTRNGYITFPAGKHRLTDEQLKEAKKQKVVVKDTESEPSTVQTLQAELAKADRQLKNFVDDNTELQKAADKSDQLAAENSTLKQDIEILTANLEREREAAEASEQQLAAQLKAAEDKLATLQAEFDAQARLLAEATAELEKASEANGDAETAPSDNA